MISVVTVVIRFVTDARHPVDDANPRDPERTHSQSQGRGEAGDAPLHSFCRTRVCRLQHRDDAQRQQKEKVFKKTFTVHSDAVSGARCSSVVRAFAHGAMGRRIDPSWGGPIELFLVPTIAPRLV